MAISLYTFLFAVTLAVFAEAKNVEFCHPASCENEIHTMCRFQKNPSSTCGKVFTTGLVSDQKIEIVKLHNELRHKVASGQEKRGHPGPQPGSKNIGPLKWSQDLANIAQVWANQCQFGHDKCRDLPTQQIGQNVAISQVYGQEPPSLTKMIMGWYDEVKDFNRNMVSSFQSVGGPMIGHYTQMVWANTTEIGCGFIRYNNEDPWISSYLVCNYGPAGNWLKHPVY